MAKCRDCGYLAFRHHSGLHLMEVTERFRKTGEAFLGKPYQDGPICAIAAWPLEKEIENDDPSEYKKVFHEERDCDQMTTWHRGFTPKEHVEMNLREQQAKREREWRQEDMELAKQSMKVSNQTVLCAAGIGFVGALVAAILTYVLTDCLN